MAVSEPIFIVNPQRVYDEGWAFTPYYYAHELNNKGEQ